MTITDTDIARLEQGEIEPRRGRTQTYGDLDVAQFLRDLGVRQVRQGSHSDWVSFRCPFHDDRRPAAGMHKVRTTWRCHACGCSGNAAVFLAMCKGITTKQAHARIMARDLHNEVPEPQGYVRKTDRANGSKEEIRVQQEHAIELLQKGARYSRAKEALVAVYGISEKTAKRRLRAAKQYLGESRLELGEREKKALPLRFFQIDEGGNRVFPELRRSNPMPSEMEGKSLPEQTTRGGSTKTQNLTPTRKQKALRLSWSGPAWQRPKVLRAGLYYELADGRVVHESRSKRARDWLQTGNVFSVNPEGS